MGCWTDENWMNHPRSGLGGSGTKASAVTYKGDDANPGYLKYTETWNDTSWTDENDTNYSNNLTTGTGGSSSSAVCFSGVYNYTEEWDGTCWATTNGLNTSRYGAGRAGTKNDALCFAGRAGASDTAKTEKYDGTSWANENDMNTARRYTTGDGTTSKALCVGGNSSGTTYMDSVEQWNGTCWSNVNGMNEARYSLACTSDDGIDALAFGGDAASGGTETTESFDGTSWQTENDMLRDLYRLFGAGNRIQALAGGGYPAGDARETQSYSEPFEAEWRSFSIATVEPTDRTTQGSIIESSNKLQYGRVRRNAMSSPQCVIFRVNRFAGFSLISDMRFYLSDSSPLSNSSIYVDITDTWTQSKSTTQVIGGNPGSCPTALPTAANLTKIGGGDIDGNNHEDTTQYIYTIVSVGGAETYGDDRDLIYTLSYDIT